VVDDAEHAGVGDALQILAPDGLAGLPPQGVDNPGVADLEDPVLGVVPDEAMRPVCGAPGLDGLGIAPWFGLLFAVLCVLGFGGGLPAHVTPALPAIEEDLAGAVVTGGIVTPTPPVWD
jgi:hypothetical protein